MQVNATYDKGKLKFDKPIQFVHTTFRVQVELPNEEILSVRKKKNISDPSDEWLSRLKAIKRKVLAIPEEELPEVTEKQKQYMKAFALREDR